METNLQEEQKGRQLPIYQIFGTDFEVHVATSELVERGNPSNRISEADMDDCGDHLEFLYDKKLKTLCATPVAAGGRYDEDFELVKLRSIEGLDPVGMFELIAQEKYPPTPEWWAELPKLEIAGTEFYVDDRTLFQVDNPWNEIQIDGIRLEEGKQALYYDTALKNLPFFKSYFNKELPENLGAHVKRYEVPTLNDDLPGKTVLKELGERKKAVSKKVKF